MPTGMCVVLIQVDADTLQNQVFDFTSNLRSYTVVEPRYRPRIRSMRRRKLYDECDCNF